MKKFAAVCAVAFTLVGCAQFQNAWNTFTGSRVSPAAVYVAENTFDSVEIISTAYLRACHKNPGAFAACAKSIESKVVGGVRAGRKTRDKLRAFMVAHPDALGAQGLYDSFTEATKALNDLIATYNLEQVR